MDDGVSRLERLDSVGGDAKETRSGLDQATPPALSLQHGR
jgi:hypothetical protein